MLTHGLNKEYTIYDKLIKCPRPSVTCKKVELRACDFLLEKCMLSICHGELREIVKARTRRFFRSTFQSWSRIINLTIICYHLCFDLIVKSFFLAVINMVFGEYSLSLQMEWTTRKNANIPAPLKNRSREINRHPFLKQGTNPKGVPFWSNKRPEKGTSEHILSQLRTALLNPSLVYNSVRLVHSDG